MENHLDLHVLVDPDTDPDGAVAAFLTFERTATDGFVATVPIDTPGTHTICVSTTCDTVDVAAASE